MMPPARVAILGAESSGKSTLAAALARRHDSVWVPEYLREFVDVHQRVPRESDQVVIAATQLAREQEAAARARTYLFCDTTPLLTCIYSRFYFGRVDAQLEALAAPHNYQVTLVTAPDTPWVADGLQRESEVVRQAIFAMLLEELKARGVDYVLLSGSLDMRLATACAHLQPAAA